MPLTLHHGPPGDEKIRAWFDLCLTAWREAQGEPGFFVLTGTAYGVANVREAISRGLADGVLAGRAVFAFDDFLFLLVKKRRHLVHRADAATCAYITFLSARIEAPELVCGGAHSAKGIANLIRRLKTRGAGPEAARSLLSRRFVDEGFFAVFARYQEALESSRHADAGDLYLAGAEALRDKNFAPDFVPSRLIVSGIHPLHAGHREILRLLKRRLPQRDIHVFYDDDFSRPADDLLSRAYEDLGSLCDEAVHYPGPEHVRLVLDVHPSPSHEAVSISRRARELIAGGYPPHAITIAAPAGGLSLLRLALETEGVRLAAAERGRLGDFFLEGKNPPTPREDILPETVRLGVPEADAVLRAARARADIEARLLFAESLFPELARGTPEEERRGFIRALIRESPLPGAAGRGRVRLVSAERAEPPLSGSLWLAGLSEENIVVPGDDTPLAPEALWVRETAELLDTPAYRVRALRGRLRRFARAPGAGPFSRSADDGSGQVHTAPHLYGIVWRERAVRGEPAPPHRRFRSDTGMEMERYAVTGLDRYLACPYKYYAGGVLRLGSLPWGGLSPSPKLRGEFVHAVLDEIFRRHADLYRGSLSDPGAMAELKDRFAGLIGTRAAGDGEMNRLLPEVRAAFLGRVTRAIAGMAEREALAFGKGGKRTLPRASEWRIGGKEGDGYRMATPAGEVTLTGRVDRVDVSEDGAWVTAVDFKTGAAPTSSEIKRGESLQFPLYLMAVAVGFGAKPSGACVVDLKSGTVGGLAIRGTADAGQFHYSRLVTGAEWEELKVKVSAGVARAVAGIRAGRFDPEPRDPGDCRFCDYRRVCGHVASGGV